MDGLATACAILCNLAASAPVQPSTPLAPRIARIGAVDSGISIGGYQLAPEFRLRTTSVYTQLSPLDDPNGAMRHRLGSSMVDIHPNATSGFRMSVGLRFLQVSNFHYAEMKATNGLLYTPRLASSGGVRAGFQRFTPAASVGYTWTVSDKMFIGVEGGTLLGSAVSGPPRGLDGNHGRDPNGVRGGVNPVANMTFALKL
jgi:hypothetical protein